MGKHDSSRTRVAPVFDRLRAIDPSGCTWLPKLMALPALEGHQALPVPGSTSPIVEAHWWPNERKLPAPLSLLKHLIHEAPKLAATAGSNLGRQPAKRLALFRGDDVTRKEALALLDDGQRTRGWHVLEGASQPDVFLGTDELVVVIEGKRTEPQSTTRTTWMPARDQMLRHLDAASEILNGRRLIGFMIVDGGGGEAATGVPADWRADALATVSQQRMAESLPHRSDEERRQIAGCFLGITTWQAVCAALDIPWAVVIDEVVAAGRW